MPCAGVQMSNDPDAEVADGIYDHLMEPIHIVREVPFDPEETWQRLTTWERHGQFVPLTSIRTTDGGFVARTAIGPIGFDDTMDVVESNAPWFCRLEKRGKVVQGWAEIRVEPTASGSRATWTEAAHVWGVPRLLSPVEQFFSRLLFGKVMDLLLRP